MSSTKVFGAVVKFGVSSFLKIEEVWSLNQTCRDLAGLMPQLTALNFSSDKQQTLAFDKLDLAAVRAVSLIRLPPFWPASLRHLELCTDALSDLTLLPSSLEVLRLRPAERAPNQRLRLPFLPRLWMLCCRNYDFDEQDLRHLASSCPRLRWLACGRVSPGVDRVLCLETLRVTADTLPVSPSSLRALEVELLLDHKFAGLEALTSLSLSSGIKQQPFLSRTLAQVPALRTLRLRGFLVELSVEDLPRGLKELQLDTLEEGGPLDFRGLGLDDCSLGMVSTRLVWFGESLRKLNLNDLPLDSVRFAAPGNLRQLILRFPNPPPLPAARPPDDLFPGLESLALILYNDESLRWRYLLQFAPPTLRELSLWGCPNPDVLLEQTRRLSLRKLNLACFPLSEQVLEDVLVLAAPTLEAVVLNSLNPKMSDERVKRVLRPNCLLVINFETVSGQSMSVSADFIERGIKLERF